MKKKNPNKTKNGIWVKCPNCGIPWLVSNTVSVEVPCKCGKTFISIPDKRKVILKYGS